MTRLVLTRKIGEAIVIDESVVRLVKTRRGWAKLVIDAPPDTKVDREEIAERKRDIRERLTRELDEAREAASWLLHRMETFDGENEAIAKWPWLEYHA